MLKDTDLTFDFSYFNYYEKPKSMDAHCFIECIYLKDDERLELQITPPTDKVVVFYRKGKNENWQMKYVGDGFKIEMPLLDLLNQTIKVVREDDYEEWVLDEIGLEVAENTSVRYKVFNDIKRTSAPLVRQGANVFSYFAFFRRDKSDWYHDLDYVYLDKPNGFMGMYYHKKNLRKIGFRHVEEVKKYEHFCESIKIAGAIRNIVLFECKYNNVDYCGEVVFEKDRESGDDRVAVYLINENGQRDYLTGSFDDYDYTAEIESQENVARMLIETIFVGALELRKWRCDNR